MSDPGPSGKRPPSPHDVPPRTIALIVGVMVAGLAVGMLLIMPHYGPRKPRHRSALGHVMPGSMIGRETNGMVWIPGGTFVMGSTQGPSDEMPLHEVTLGPFWMDKTEVTHSEFAKFVSATGYQNWEPSGGAENHPVTQVTWDAAAAYAKWAGKRLPTEAEWEYAARGGLHQQAYVWGDQPPSTNQANLNGPGSMPVSTFPPNGYGLHDMAGNVAEWCSDGYDPQFYARSPKLNPKGATEPAAERVIRGGSFLSGPASDQAFRPGARRKAPPETKRADLGFRCVREVF